MRRTARPRSRYRGSDGDADPRHGRQAAPPAGLGGGLTFAAYLKADRLMKLDGVPWFPKTGLMGNGFWRALSSISCTAAFRLASLRRSNSMNRLRSRSRRAILSLWTAICCANSRLSASGAATFEAAAASRRSISSSSLQSASYRLTNDVAICLSMASWFIFIPSEKPGYRLAFTFRDSASTHRRFSGASRYTQSGGGESV